ncbi:MULTISPECIES: AsnC family transcriptional regulator [Actinomadura]|uniref:AsnC family transcriptional regulator n=1 Tax=Actinomadura yumaensis TaxID=111807 RepID=A0ABW2CMJ2_9ACTN|nr:AsnC family transcriptional regulator [Actinomadura sp. J1-007]MWK37896.1 AsnC family transcriptional regulator [Actinomadura sp. J1-007]
MHRAFSTPGDGSRVTAGRQGVHRSIVVGAGAGGGMRGQVPMVCDDTDIALLALLQQDGRATYQELADRVRLSRTAARARVQ